MENNTKQTIMVESIDLSSKKRMIVVNPHNGEKVDLMPFFDYMNTLQDLGPVNPSLVAKVIEDMTEGHIDLLSDILDNTDGISLSDNSLAGHTYAIQKSFALRRVFNNMTITK